MALPLKKSLEKKGGEIILYTVRREEGSLLVGTELCSLSMKEGGIEIWGKRKALERKNIVRRERGGDALLPFWRNSDSHILVPEKNVHQGGGRCGNYPER